MDNAGGGFEVTPIGVRVFRILVFRFFW